MESSNSNNHIYDSVSSPFSKHYPIRAAVVREFRLHTFELV